MALVCASTVLAFGCASPREASPPDRPLAILEEPPPRDYVALWPVQARARADAGQHALEEKLREAARDVGADAILIRHRYYDPSPAPGDEREFGLLANAYPPLLEKLEPGAIPRAGTGVRVYGPIVVVEGLAIRYRERTSANVAASDVGLT